MRRILVVDDEKSIRVTLSEFLRDDGYEVRVAEDVMAATELMAKEEFDVVLTDIILPRVSGVDLLMIIRESSPLSPVIMMTGEPTIETAAESVRAGAFDYLAKPITKDIVLKTVRNALKVKALNEDKQRLEVENRRYQQNLEQLVEERTTQVIAEKARTDHLNTVLRAIREVNQLITKEKERQTLLQSACNILIETRGYSNTWIVLLDEDKRATATFKSGMGASFEPMAERLGRGELPHCMKTALSQREVVVVEDPPAKCGDCPFSGQYRGKAGMCIRLKHGDKIFGLLSMATQLEFACDGEELSLLQEVADDIAFALYSMEVEIERRQAVEELSKSENKHRELHSMLRLMCDNLPELIWCKDLQSRFLFANKACCEDLINAKSIDEPIGKTDIFFSNREKESHPEDPEYHTFGETCTNSDLAVLEIKKPLRFEESGNLKGKFVCLDVCKAPFWDKKGKLIGTVGCAKDITIEKEKEKEKLELEAQFRQAQKMETLARLAGGVAHDFNNMLSIIIGYGEIVKLNLSPNDQLCQDVEQIIMAGRKSADLTSQLLAFSRQQIVTSQSLNINEIIGDSKKMLGRLLGEDIALTFTPSSDLWQIKIDPSQIDQILANLSVNARDAIDEVGSITIETKNIVLDEAYGNIHNGLHPGEYVMISFRDSGRGMDQKTMAQIFDPFFTTKEVGKGTGLGLSTIYGIVEQNEGYVNVSSEIGQGTTFDIYLPRYSGSVEQQVTESAAIIQGGTETILLVDDEEQLTVLCERILKQQGYTMLSATHPEEAIVLAEKCRSGIHLLVTDIIMPSMNGKQLYEKIAQIKPGIKVLFMSGYMSDKIKDQNIQVEKVNFIQKPFDTHDFVMKVRQIIDAK